MNWRENVLNSTDNDGLEAETVRLQVYLAHAGLTSRRGAEEMITLGRVRVNGSLVKERGFRVKPEDSVTVDGKPVQLVQKKVYVALNKPVGYVCSNDDPEGRALAKDLIHSYNDMRLFSVGRLDYLSAGLIFFTNDGTFSNLVSHPRAGVDKEYEIETRKEIPDEFLEEFIKGIYVAGERYRIESWKRIGPRKVSLVLREGKNREIRNAFAARRITIKNLVRTRIGCVKLGTLAPGAYRVLGNHEIQWFISQEGANHGRGN
jgi:23S rRNA pseudouridine2605 synthase